MPGESSVKPVSVLHVGDNLHTDVGGAASVGMSTVWIKGFTSSKLLVTENPDFTATSYLSCLGYSRNGRLDFQIDFFTKAIAYWRNVLRLRSTYSR